MLQAEAFLIHLSVFKPVQVTPGQYFCNNMQFLGKELLEGIQHCSDSFGLKTFQLSSVNFLYLKDF